MPPDMRRKASDIDDPHLLIDRVLYRDKRLQEAAREPKRNLHGMIRIMTGFNRADLNRLKELLP